MNPHALVQARQRFARADAAIAEFEAASNYCEAETAWTDFLLAASTIYSKLEQGAKGNGKSGAWFGRQKKARKDNQILRYLHFARNSDEHGIERVTERSENNKNIFKFGERREATFYHAPDSDTGELRFKGTAWACGPCIDLIRARDSRFGDFCDPPQMEGSAPKDPLALGRVAMPMIEAMLEEAEALI